jgi:hypothetical protein
MHNKTGGDFTTPKIITINDLMDFHHILLGLKIIKPRLFKNAPNPQRLWSKLAVFRGRKT